MHGSDIIIMMSTCSYNNDVMQLFYGFSYFVWYNFIHGHITLTMYDFVGSLKDWPNMYHEHVMKTVCCMMEIWESGHQYNRTYNIMTLCYAILWQKQKSLL